MARVRGGALSVNEPARAAMTAVAVRLGLALAREEAGNEVIRLSPQEVAAVLGAQAFGSSRRPGTGCTTATTPAVPRDRSPARTRYPPLSSRSRG